MLVIDSPWIAGSWFAASRIGYVLFVALALRAEEERGATEPRDEAWDVFRRRAAWIMDNDAIAFVAFCIVTAGTFQPPLPWSLTLAAGAVLTAVGAFAKVWANASLAPGSFYWRNFFRPPEPHTLTAKGPYRWIRNPMYTVGYAHTYGIALAFQSPPGLVASAFSQAMILALHFLVEEPHLERIRMLAEAKAAENVPQPPAAMT